MEEPLELAAAFVLPLLMLPFARVAEAAAEERPICLPCMELRLEERGMAGMSLELLDSGTFFRPGKENSELANIS